MITCSSRDRRAIRCPKRQMCNSLMKRRTEGRNNCPWRSKERLPRMEAVSTTIVVFNKDFRNLSLSQRETSIQTTIALTGFLLHGFPPFLESSSTQTNAGTILFGSRSYVSADPTLKHARCDQSGYHPKCRYWNTNVS